MSDVDAPYRALFETTRDGILIVNDEGRYVEVNRSLCAILKAPRERLIGAHFSEFIPPDLLGEAVQAFASLRNGGETPVEFPLRALDGTTVELEWVSASHYLPGLHFCSCRDISQRKQSEKALRDSEERFRRIVETAEEGIWILDLTSHTTFANRRMGELLGYQPMEILGRSCFDFIHPDDRPRALENFARRKQGDVTPREYRAYRRDGAMRWLSFTASRLRDASGELRGVLSMCTDVTERHLAEEALRVREEESRTLLANLPDVISRFDRQLRFVYMSPAITQITGIPAESFLGKTHVQAGIAEEVAERLRSSLRQIFVTGERDVVEFDFESSLGLRHFYAVGVPEFGPDGEVVTALSIARDITERKEFERQLQESLVREQQARARAEEMNEALRRANVDLEQFAYSASHDLKEPLRMVAIYTELLRRRYAGRLDEQANDYIRYAVEGAHRMELLVNDLLEYIQIANLREHPASLVEVRKPLQSALASLEAAIRESSARISHGELPSVKVHQVHLHQLFQNLIGNAIKYRGPASPAIEISAEQRDKEWLFMVRDNGIGIAAEYVTQVFGLFRRLHPNNQYPGTGIGLAICHKIVENYGGRIWVESKLGKGSAFFFTIPAET